MAFSDVKMWIMTCKVNIVTQSSWPLKTEEQEYEVLCMVAYYNAFFAVVCLEVRGVSELMKKPDI